MTERTSPVPLRSATLHAPAGPRTFGPATLPNTLELVERKRSLGIRISVGIPAVNESPTIAGICGVIRAQLMDDVGLVDELVVLDGASTDGTATAAREAGATAIDIQEVLPHIPVVRGKGEALWRSLAATTGDIVVWIDADIRNFAPHFITRLVAPLLVDDQTSFVKGFYRRPVWRAGDLAPEEGGRVTELLAKPLLDALFPELSGFRQPLAGEYAGRREVLTRVGFLTGYSVEVGLLIDLLGLIGIEEMAQVDLDERVHRNRSLAELAPTARAIARTIFERAETWGRITLNAETSLGDGADPELERPPMAIVRAATDRYRVSARRKNSAL